MYSLLLIPFLVVCEHAYFSFKVNNHLLNVDIISFLPFTIMFMETSTLTILGSMCSIYSSKLWDLKPH